jgi:MlaC protein
VSKIVQILRKPGMKSSDERKILFAEMKKSSNRFLISKKWRRAHLLDTGATSPRNSSGIFFRFSRSISVKFIWTDDLRRHRTDFFTREIQDQNFAEVDTKAITGAGETISVGYLLEKLSSDWKIYDVLVDNVSIVNNFRAQFDRVISHSSYQELVARIKEKTDEKL